MSNNKITGNMTGMDIVILMAEGNPGALTVLIQMMKSTRSFLDILLLDLLDIRGSKIWVLYNDCCGQNIDKFYRTLMVLRCGAYSNEEIQGNLNLCRAIPFLDDSIPTYNEDFNEAYDKWEEYVKANRQIVAPKIHKLIEEKNKQYRKKY